MQTMLILCKFIQTGIRKNKTFFWSVTDISAYYLSYSLSFTWAEVIQQGTAESEAVFGTYSDVMAGDLALAQRITITAAKLLAPEVVVKYSAIFDDPKAQPTSYEFTPGGRAQIKTIFAEFANMKAGMLMIEGHTDQKGSAEQNQIESYQRALTVRQGIRNC
jgi:OmpA family